MLHLENERLPGEHINYNLEEELHVLYILYWEPKTEHHTFLTPERVAS